MYLYDIHEQTEQSKKANWEGILVRCLAVMSSTNFSYVEYKKLSCWTRKMKTGKVVWGYFPITVKWYRKKMYFPTWRSTTHFIVHFLYRGQLQVAYRIWQHQDLHKLVWSCLAKTWHMHIRSYIYLSWTLQVVVIKNNVILQK